MEHYGCSVNLYNLIMDFIPKVKWHRLREIIWGPNLGIGWQDRLVIMSQLDKGYYIILTEDRGSLSSWGVKLLHFLLHFKWCRYTHALVNVEPTNAERYVFLEAINTGVKFSHFHEVFNCDSVVFLRPKWYTQEEFDSTVEDIYSEIGKDYDKKFKYDDPQDRSCVEIARQRMMTLPDYHNKMRVFEHMIKYKKNLTPQMLRDCPDFEVVLEIKR